MKSCLAFIKKEWMEQIRSGKLLILGLLFVLLGIMSPAIAKLTPKLLETFADSLSGNGIAVTAVKVTAMDAWVQFFKNIPIGLIVFILLESGIFTREVQTGALVLSLTKGLPRRTVVISKTAVPAVLWTVCYWTCAGVTRGYSAYYWENAVVRHLGFAVFCPWLFGLWVLALMTLFSTVSRANTGVLAGAGGTVLVCFLLGMLPRLGEILPIRLMDGTSLISGQAGPEAYTVPLIIAAAMIPACFAAGLVIFDRKQL